MAPANHLILFVHSLNHWFSGDLLVSSHKPQVNPHQIPKETHPTTWEPPHPSLPTWGSGESETCRDVLLESAEAPPSGGVSCRLLGRSEKGGFRPTFRGAPNGWMMANWIALNTANCAKSRVVVSSFKFQPTHFFETYDSIIKLDHLPQISGVKQKNI